MDSDLQPQLLTGTGAIRCLQATNQRGCRNEIITVGIFGSSASSEQKYFSDKTNIFIWILWVRRSVRYDQVQLLFQIPLMELSTPGLLWRWLVCLTTFRIYWWPFSQFSSARKLSGFFNFLCSGHYQSGGMYSLTSNGHSSHWWNWTRLAKPGIVCGHLPESTTKIKHLGNKSVAWCVSYQIWHVSARFGTWINLVDI
jgi:hypothetical protein